MNFLKNTIEKSKSNPLTLEMSLNNINLFLQGTSENQICVGQGITIFIRIYSFFRKYKFVLSKT